MKWFLNFLLGPPDHNCKNVNSTIDQFRYQFVNESNNWIFCVTKII